jgi:hypothetical protein
VAAVVEAVVAVVVEAVVAVAASGDVQAVAVAVLALEDAEDVEAALALEDAAVAGGEAAEVAACRGEVATTARRSPRHDLTTSTTRVRGTSYVLGVVPQLDTPSEQDHDVRHPRLWARRHGHCGLAAEPGPREV